MEKVVPKIAQNDEKWPKNGEKWPKMAKNGEKMAKNGRIGDFFGDFGAYTCFFRRI